MKRSPPPEKVEKFCYVAEFDHMHGAYTSMWGSICPKCEDYVSSERGRDPRDDSYRHRLAEGIYSFHPALEDWYPCFYGGLVGVGILEPTSDPRPKWVTSPPGSCLIRVLGADDTSMARECDSYEEAREIVRALPCIIVKDDLLARGFHYD